MGFPAISNAGDKQIKSKPIADKVKTLLFKAFDDVNHPQFFEVDIFYVKLFFFFFYFPPIHHKGTIFGYFLHYFQIWDTLPHTYGSKSHSKLNFRLHVHFNCRSVTVNRLSLADCMQNIRNFFDREGSFLASEQEYIHFFALPFVMEPREHPSFKGLFEVWNDDIFLHTNLDILCK